MEQQIHTEADFLNDVCPICKSKMRDDYCKKGHIRLKADIIKKKMKLIDEFTGPMGGSYSLWVDKLIGICIHNNDDEIVSVVSMKSGEYLYIDEKTKNGLAILEGRII